MRLRLRFVVLIAALLCAWRGSATADDKKPDDKQADANSADGRASPDQEAFLKGKGLLRVDQFFMLPEEHDVYKQMAGLDTLKRAVVGGQRQEQKAEQDEAANKKLIVTYLEQRRALRAQLDQNPPANVYNHIVSQINELGDRVLLLEKESEDSSPVKPALEAAGKAREAYVEQLLQIRRQIDKLQEKYADLAADPKIKAAIADYNQAHGKHLKLGPTASLISNDRKLKKFEETVLSDSIDIRRGGSQLWEVQVVFNGRPPVTMFIDTGASVVALSYKAAQAAGLTPTDSDPTIQMSMADGRVVKAKKVIAKSVRVGKFEADKVECVVMPADLRDAGSLLGQTFLRNFTYKIDSERSKLVMTRVDAGPPAAAKGVK